MTDTLDGFIVARKDGSLHCVAVDREDYARVEAAGPWHMCQTRGMFYAQHVGPRRAHARRPHVKLHRFLLGLEPGDPRQADHIDGNGLNNCKANLRIVTNAQNGQNHAPQRGSSSRFRGVGWLKGRKKWQAQVAHHGRSYFFGYFDSEEAAAHAAAQGRAQLFTHVNEDRHPVVPAAVERVA